ncbi:MAG: hypothetical protein AAFR16_06165 [Pseudomonadota bacterium]
MMRAIKYDRFGAAEEVLRLEEPPTPTPGPGEVAAALRTSGVNPSDIRGGRAAGWGRPRRPFPRSRRTATAQASPRRGSASGFGSGTASGGAPSARPGPKRIALPAAQAVRLPNGASFEAGAVVGVPGLTAAHTVLGGGPVHGATVLVSGAAGAVGRGGRGFRFRRSGSRGAHSRSDARLSRGPYATRPAAAGLASPDPQQHGAGAAAGEVMRGGAGLKVEHLRDLDVEGAALQHIRQMRDRRGALGRGQ